MSHTVRRLLAGTGTTLVTTALTLTSVGATTAAGTAWTAAAGPRVSSLVVARSGQVAEAAAAVRAAGGKVGTALPIINGFQASVSSAAAARLNRSASVLSVTADSSMTSASSSYDPSVPGASYAATSRASSVWATGDTGAGATVAVLDTGVANVPDLSSRLVGGIDLSGEGDSLKDSYGHGTVMAGLIAGSGASSGGAFPGIAPSARIVSVKVAGRSGAADVSTVLAGLQWIGTFAQQYGIQVVSLAWGSPSHQSDLIDPLDFAVERLWGMGITVVVAAGNAGPGAYTITKPGDDPAVITAGAFNDQATVYAGDDAALDFSSRGPTATGVSKPDLVAPGRTLVATSSPGSKVVQDNPQALVAGGYIRGSGTSQATAVTAGGVALLLSAHPSLTPDQVKYALKATATPISGVSSDVQGAGEVRLSRAVSANVSAAPTQSLYAMGGGSLEASRGDYHVLAHCPGQSTTTLIQGEVTAWCHEFDTDVWTTDVWTTDVWTTDVWTTDVWTTDVWTTDVWTTDVWTADVWTTDVWTSQSWDSGPSHPASKQA
jgi:serine protease AprX